MRAPRGPTQPALLAPIALPALALLVCATASARAAEAASGEFASTGTCGDGPGPACYIEYTCVEWGLRFYPAFPPTDMLVCERWAVTDVRYWHGGRDGSGGEPDGEDAPVAPEAPEATTG